MHRPLADEIRPKTLDEVVGQRHLLAPGGVLRRLIDAGTDANMVFYGPSGTGKTTVANIIAEKTHKTLYRLNATTASLQDVKDIIADVGTLLAPGGILLYLDEIQYFNKKQQQSLLEFMENGSLTLIASTTENPFFYVYNALLSRSSIAPNTPHVAVCPGATTVPAACVKTANSSIHAALSPYMPRCRFRRVFSRTRCLTSATRLAVSYILFEPPFRFVWNCGLKTLSLI